MFSSKKPEGPMFPSSHAEADKAPAAPRNYANYGNIADSACSIINERLVMRGDLESEADILVKGTVHGNITCKLLIIDTDAVVEGGIMAEELVVRGKTKGVVRANRVRLEKSAHVDSEIWHENFSAEEGARITGALRYMKEPLNVAKTPTHASSAVDVIVAELEAAPSQAGGGAAVSPFFQQLDAARASAQGVRPNGP